MTDHVTVIKDPIRAQRVSNGTGLRGNFTSSYNKLKKMFGEPAIIDTDEEYHWNWVFLYSGEIFTIYDRGPKRGEDEEVVFHVGGKNYAGFFTATIRKALQTPGSVVIREV